MQLPAGTTLDRESVIWPDGRIDFSATQITGRVQRYST